MPSGEQKTILVGSFSGEAYRKSWVGLGYSSELFPGVLNLGLAWVGILPEVEKFLVVFYSFCFLAFLLV